MYREFTPEETALAERIVEMCKKGALQLNKTRNNRYNEGMKPEYVLAVLLSGKNA